MMSYSVYVLRRGSLRKTDETESNTYQLAG